MGPVGGVAEATLLALGVGAWVWAAYAGFVHLIALWLPVNLAGLALVWKQNLSIRDLAGGGQIPEPALEQIDQPSGRTGQSMEDVS